MLEFKIIHKDKKSRARVGEIKTSKKIINTPAFVAVGTSASVKSLTPEEILKTKTQVIFVNALHLHLRPGEKIIKDAGNINNFMKWKGLIMSDSGGFQVFSFSRQGNNLIKFKNEGVEFISPWDGTKHFLTAGDVIRIQNDLGSDFAFCLDDCTTYPVNIQKAKISMQRTMKWASESFKVFQKVNSEHKQNLYGIIQGSVFKDLRIECAEYISSIPFDGIAIGGVSVGESKEEMKKVLEWVVPKLAENKPRHLLGVGEIDDIFALVKAGIDTFDCVMPTRLGRMGHILIKSQDFNQTQKFSYDITKSKFSADYRPPDLECNCYTCRNFTRAYINHLFRCRELLAYRLATFHNLYFINRLMFYIRKAIRENKLDNLEKQWLNH